MLVRGIFICLTIFIVSFLSLLWIPNDIAVRIPIIVAIVTFSSVVVNEILKYVLSYEKQKVRGM